MQAISATDPLEQWCHARVTLREELIPGVTHLPTQLVIDHCKAEHYSDATSTTREEVPVNNVRLLCRIRTTTTCFSYPRSESREVFVQRLREVVESHLANTRQLPAVPEQPQLTALDKILGNYTPHGRKVFWLPFGFSNSVNVVWLTAQCSTVNGKRIVEVTPSAETDQVLGLVYGDNRTHALDQEGRALLLAPSAVSGCLSIQVLGSPFSSRSLRFQVAARREDTAAVLAWLKDACAQAYHNMSFSLATARVGRPDASTELGVASAVVRAGVESGVLPGVAA